jgi:hypothetical protein
MKNDRVALHLVCELAPNYFYTDLIEAMVQANDESPASMDAVRSSDYLLCH